MEITRIQAYQVDLPLHEGRYQWSGGKGVDVFDTTVVAVTTDEGTVGYGEACPLGPAYLPAYAEGVRAGLRELGPSLIGEDPTHLGKINRTMDHAMQGHPYVKSPIDVACWDILGQVSGQSICTLLGGPDEESVQLYRAISQDTPEAMAESVGTYRTEGYTRFQLKVGGDPDVDIQRIEAVAAQMQPGEKLVADANTGWLRHEAMRVCDAVRNIDVYIEQPCEGYDACLNVRRHTDRPFVLDESITDLPRLTRAISDAAMDVVNLKISKLGGLTKARLARDLCVAHGIAMTLEDTWGGDLVTAAIAHLAHSTPAACRFTATDFNSYGPVVLARDAPRRDGGHLAATTTPGLGCTPDPDVLGDPVIDIA